MSRIRLSQLTGKPASSLAFGVMQWGGKADRSESAAMYEMTRDAGITVFDAAYIYTGGQAELLLGEFTEGDRDALTLITKCGFRPGQTGAEMTAQVRESLKRLRTDHVEIVFLHRYPGDDMLRGALMAMRDLKADGAFGCLGASNFAAWEVMKARALAREIGAPEITLLQPMYNLVKRQAEVEILPMAEREGLGVLTYSPLGGGLLTGKYARGETGRIDEDDAYRARYGPDWMKSAASALAELAREHGTAPETLAVAWAARHPGVSAPIISSSRADQLAPSLAAAEFTLPESLMDRLSALTPAPPPATDRLEEA